jgi:hypothetical protein
MEPCRFCLETDTTLTNPLISPCSCTGSVKYIHQKCLYKWILIDASSKKMHCSICNKLFQIVSPIEIVPQRNTISLVLLNNTFLIMLFLHYFKMVYWINEPYPLVRAVIWNVTETNIAFHLILLILAYKNLYVVRPGDYWSISMNKYIGVSILHLISLMFPYPRSPIMIYYMAFNARSFWTLHCETLERSNRLLLEGL